MKLKIALLALLAMFTIASCSDDESPYKCSDCVNEPQALAANDGSGEGIYKGVLIGSSGTIFINMDNEGDGISMILEIDGEEIELTTESTYSEGGFEGYFYGTMDDPDDVQIGFHVNSTGSEWGFYDIIIPGHEDVTIQIYKELSTALVMGFEGTFSGGPGGTFNMVVITDGEEGYWVAISRTNPTQEEPEPETNYFEGQVFDEDDLLGGGGNVIIVGEIDDDNIEGAWESGDETGTWKGKRTL